MTSELFLDIKEVTCSFSDVVQKQRFRFEEGSIAINKSTPGDQYGLPNAGETAPILVLGIVK
jgi:hypothetical protein